MKRILVGVDGSQESKDAAEWAADLAQATGSTLVLAFVVFPAGGAADAQVYAGLLEAEEQYGAQVLREMVARCTRRGVAVETMMQQGAPAETLADLATKGNVDLIAVGHRGRGALKRLLLGSVADRLVQTGPRPVLVVR